MYMCAPTYVYCICGRRPLYQGRVQYFWCCIDASSTALIDPLTVWAQVKDASYKCQTDQQPQVPFPAVYGFCPMLNWARLGPLMDACVIWCGCCMSKSKKTNRRGSYRSTICGPDQPSIVFCFALVSDKGSGWGCMKS